MSEALCRPAYAPQLLGAFLNLFVGDRDACFFRLVDHDLVFDYVLEEAFEAAAELQQLDEVFSGHHLVIDANELCHVFPQNLTTGVHRRLQVSRNGSST